MHLCGTMDCTPKVGQKLLGCVSECVWNFSSGFFMEDFGTDSRMQTRECSGLHDRVKGAKTTERPIKAHPRAYHGIFTPFPAFHSLHSPLCASFQDSESPVKLPVKIRIKIQTHSQFEAHPFCVYAQILFVSNRVQFDAVDSSILVFVQAVSDIFANFADYLYKSGCALD